MIRVQRSTYQVKRHRLAGIVAFVVAITAVASGAEVGSRSGLALLQTARAVHSMASAEAERGHPVRLRGWVTYYDPYEHPTQAFLFLHDRTGDIFVFLPKQPQLDVRRGNYVEVTGVSGSGEFAPVVANGQVRVLDTEVHTIPADRVDLPLLMLGGYDARFVEVDGIVQGLDRTEHNVTLKLATDNGVVRATTPRRPDVDYTRLIDAQIRVRANIAPEFNQRRQVTGARLYFADMADVQIERGPRPDPFSAPLREVNGLTQIGSGLEVLNSIHIRGRATLHWPGRLLCVADASGGLCVESRQPDPVALGELVDVVGFPKLENSTPGLVEARFRQSGDLRPSNPVRATTAELLSGEHPDELVTIQGKVIGSDQYPGTEFNDERLTMESDGRVFRAVLPSGLRMPNGQVPPKGSLLRLTGVCLPEINSHHEEVSEQVLGYETFRLLLRTPGDVTVLDTPSWWSGPHVFYLLLVSGVVGTAGCVWVIVLRRRVEEQTKVIRESEERFRHLAEHDGLTGLPNRRLLNERLHVAFEEAKARCGSMAVLMMDLDKFKQVNDSFGHHAGDRMLCVAAERISGCVRSGDMVARTGGDEFVILLHRLNHAREAEEVAAKIVKAISAPLEFEGHRIPMSASVGICAYPGGGSDVETLLRNCDTSLYGAKALGRNCWKAFTGLDLQTTQA